MDEKEEFLLYIKNVIEKGKKPICPFAKQARVKGKIMFFVFPFKTDEIQPEIEHKLKDFYESDYQILILIHPDRNLDLKELVRYKEKFDLEVFEVHPKYEFEFMNQKTRKDPFPNLQFIKPELLSWGREIIKKSNYY